MYANLKVEIEYETGAERTFACSSVRREPEGDYHLAIDANPGDGSHAEPGGTLVIERGLIRTIEITADF